MDVASVVIVVDLEGEAPVVTLRDPDDFGRFHVEVSAAVGVDAVKSLAAAAGAGGEEWDEGFANMLEYAKGKGWLTEDGAAIQAHVEQVGG